MSAPQTFRTSPGSYAAFCGVLSVLPVLSGYGVLLGRADFNTPFIFSVGLVAAAAIWLAYFRLRVDDSGIEYRDLFGRNFKVAYSEIASLKRHWTSGGHSALEWHLHLHDGRRLRINLKPFPREVEVLLRERIKCAA